LDFVDGYSRNIQASNFIKGHPVVVDLFYADRQTDRETNRQTQTDRQTDRQAARQTGRQTD